MSFYLIKLMTDRHIQNKRLDIDDLRAFPKSSAVFNRKHSVRPHTAGRAL